MKAIQYQSYGDYTENRFVDLPQPALGDREVLVAMRTVGINPLDNTFRSGHFYGATPENLPRIGGQTGAGVVAASKSDAFTVGNRVFVRGPGFGIMADGSLLGPPQVFRSFLIASTTITPRPILRVRDI